MVMYEMRLHHGSRWYGVDLFFSFFLFAVVRMDGRALKPVFVKIYNGVDLYVYFSRHPYLLPDVGTQRASTEPNTRSGQL